MKTIKEMILLTNQDIRANSTVQLTKTWSL